MSSTNKNDLRQVPADGIGEAQSAGPATADNRRADGGDGARRSRNFHGRHRRGSAKVPIQGSRTLFLCGAALHLFAATSLGIFLATFARTMPQFALLLILVLLPLQMLSGGMTPRESMPVWVQQIMLAAPTTHFVMLAQGILYRGAGLTRSSCKSRKRHLRSWKGPMARRGLKTRANGSCAGKG